MLRTGLDGYTSKTGKATMEWWSKQCDNVKIRSLKQNRQKDEIFEVGYEHMEKMG
jgi:hypothetical protein